MAEAETSTTETTTATNEGDTSGDVDTSTVLGGATTEGAEGDDSLSGGNGSDTQEGAEGKTAETPVVPEAYELSAPEGFTIDPALMEAVTPDFKEAGLTNDQAQKLMPAAIKFAESLKKQGEQQLIGSVMAERTAWAEEAKADPDIGGAKWDQTLAMSAKALDALPENVGKPLRSLLNDSGLGNKREMIAAMSFFGRAISEDTSTPGDHIAAETQVPIAHQVFPNNVRKGQ